MEDNVVQRPVNGNIQIPTIQNTGIKKSAAIFFYVLLAISVIIIAVFIYQKVSPKGITFLNTGPVLRSESLLSSEKAEINAQTATWETYTNPNYNFSFKYPENLQTKDSSSQQTITGSAPQFTIVFYKDFPADVPVTDHNQFELVVNYFKTPDNAEGFVDRKVGAEDLQVINKTINHYVKTYPDRVTNTNFMINTETNEVVEISTTVYNDTPAKLISEWTNYYDLVLTTFKFTN